MRGWQASKGSDPKTTQSKVWTLSKTRGHVPPPRECEGWFPWRHANENYWRDLELRELIQVGKVRSHPALLSAVTEP